MINPYPEQEPFIAADGRNILHACPGSGKTTAIALKLKRLTSCWPHDHSGVLAISFTNTAVDELLVKFQDASGVPLGYPHAAMTIDRFTTQYITLPFAREIVGARKELRI